MVDWTDSDEQLYRALRLEQRFSTEAIGSAMEYVGSAYYPCTLYEILTSRGDGIQYYWKMPRRWYADPLNPWNLTLLILWIPINVIYFCFQGTRSLASARNGLSLPAQDIARLEPTQLSFSPSLSRLSGPIAYTSITSLGYYANGLRIDRGGKRLLLSAAAAPSLFVALRHLAPGATVTSGLIVPDDFIERCSQSGRKIDVGQMRENPPPTWAAEPKDYKPSVPPRAIVGYGIIAAVILFLIALSL